MYKIIISVIISEEFKPGLSQGARHILVWSREKGVGEKCGEKGQRDIVKVGMCRRSFLISQSSQSQPYLCHLITTYSP